VRTLQEIKSTMTNEEIKRELRFGWSVALYELVLFAIVVFALLLTKMKSGTHG